MKRKTKRCDKCTKEISLSNFNKHYNSCKGLVDKKIINIDDDWVQENGKYKCPYCNKEYTKMGIGIHIWRNHTEEGKKHDPNIGYKYGRIIWNKGLTKENNISLQNQGKTFSKRYKEGLFTLWKGKHHTIETKEKISNKMKLAHKEKRAWNMGKSRWNNKPSYPEQFFMKVIENEFDDKNYIREYPMGIYSLDFAWVEKKKVIEIDGDQHQRFKEYKERDERKDKYLSENGWKILRISWKDMCNDTKEQINKCKSFIK